MPVGLWFEDKVALRSRVLVRAGEPLDLDHELWSILPEGAEATDEDHESVRALTAVITERLRAVSPDFDTFLDSAAFSWAADIALREGMERPQQSVPLAQREPLAARLARSDADERALLTGELGRYSLALDALGVTDEELVPQATPASLFKRAVWLAIGVLLLAPFAIAGFLINAIPALLVVVAGLTVKSPVTKGTVRILVAIIVFPLAWLLVAWFDVGGAVDLRGARGALVPALAVDRRRLRQPIRLLGRSARLRDSAPLRALRDLDPRVARRARASRAWVVRGLRRAERSSKRS